jgi:toxin ParE1/3/4
VFFLTQKAKNDLKNIARYTESEWGREQRNFYLKQIDESFQLLSETPDIGLNCDYIREGYRKYRTGRHFVFYRLVGDEIEIARVLHERMNVEVHLQVGEG